MKRFLKGLLYTILLCLVFMGVILFLSFITSYVPSLNWSVAFEAMSALGTILIPLAVVYIETKVERTRTKIESENAETIKKMSVILEENQKVLHSIKEFEDEYGEDIKALARVRRSNDNLLTGKTQDGNLHLTTIPLK